MSRLLGDAFVLELGTLWGGTNTQSSEKSYQFIMDWRMGAHHQIQEACFPYCDACLACDHPTLQDLILNHGLPSGGIGFLHRPELGPHKTQWPGFRQSGSGA